MSKESKTWEERAKDIVAEDWENEHDLYLKAEIIKYSPDSSIQLLEEYKQALKKEIEREVSINNTLIVSKDKRTFEYLQYANLGLKKSIELIDTVKPTEK